MTAATKQTGLLVVTVDGLRAISAAILANPSAYDQNNFIADFESEQERGCVAFHHVKLTRTARQLSNLMEKHREWRDVSYTGISGHPFYRAAQKDLKLTDDQAKRLLSAIFWWPNKFDNAYINAKTAKGRARALHNRIEFFIATDGTDLTQRQREAERQRSL